MLIRRAEVDGVAPVDVRVAGGRVAQIARALAPGQDEPTLDAAGGALLPGLHDHHIHLFALAAAARSLRCGPPEVRDRAALAAAVAGADRALAPGAWLRGVGYHESVAGWLDRERLDALAPGRPLRIQHRSGALWIVNSRGVERLGLEGNDAPAGVERDARGRASGRLFGLDAWLRARLRGDAGAEAPSLAGVGRMLSSFGVTGVTDATPDNDAAALRALAGAVGRGELPQRLVLMGAPSLPEPDGPGIERGAVKLVLRERELPRFDELAAAVGAAHAAGRPLALHCATRAELVLAAAAFEAGGCLPGDRIEHASVAPPEVLELLAELPLAVVTQPHFVRERGDAYLAGVEAREQPWLYRCRGFLDAGVPLGGGSDAPFGHPDPWRAMRAAVERRTEAGRAFGADEALDPERALALFTSPAEAPGAPPRRVVAGAVADLCLLDGPWAVARRDLDSRHVAASWRGGALVWRAG